MAEFFHMGGYGFFVWLSYAIVFVAFTYAYVAPLLRHRNLLLEISRATYLHKQGKVVATMSNAQTDSVSTDEK